MSIDTFLRLTDRYMIDVNIKGGSIPWTVKEVWFTCNFEPKDWFPFAAPVQKQAILNRFSRHPESRIVHLEHAPTDEELAAPI